MLVTLMITDIRYILVTLLTDIRYMFVTLLTDIRYVIFLMCYTCTKLCIIILFSYNNQKLDIRLEKIIYRLSC